MARAILPGTEGPSPLVGAEVLRIGASKTAERYDATKWGCAVLACAVVSGGTRYDLGRSTRRWCRFRCGSKREVALRSSLTARAFRTIPSALRAPASPLRG